MSIIVAVERDLVTSAESFAHEWNSDPELAIQAQVATAPARDDLAVEWLNDVLMSISTGLATSALYDLMASYFKAKNVIVTFESIERSDGTKIIRVSRRES